VTVARHEFEAVDRLPGPYLVARGEAVPGTEIVRDEAGYLVVHDVVEQPVY
jgi:hypothetical protein